MFALLLAMTCLYLATATGVLVKAASLKPLYRLLFLPLLIAIFIEAVWHVLPNAHMLIVGAASDAHLDSTAVGNVLDFLNLIIWVGAFWLGVTLVRNGLSRQGLSPDPDELFCGVDTQAALRGFKMVLWFVFGCMIIYYPLAQALGWPLGYAVNEYFIRDVDLGQFPLLNLSLIRIRMMGPALAATCILLRGGQPLSLKNAMPLSVLAWAALMALASGNRGGATQPIAMLLVVAFIMRKQLKTTFLIAMSTGFLLLVISPVLVAIRTEKDFSEITPLSVLNAIISGSDSSDPGAAGAGLDRLNKAYFSGVAYENTNNEGVVGLRPYYGIPFLLVPRMVFVDKPMMGSSDGTEYGLLSFRAHYWATGVYGTSVNVGNGGTAYWMGGWAGVVFISLIEGFLVGIIWPKLNGVSGRPFWLAVFFTVLVDGFVHGDFGYLVQLVLQNSLLLLAVSLPIILLGGFRPRREAPIVLSVHESDELSLPAGRPDGSPVDT